MVSYNLDYYICLKLPPTEDALFGVEIVDDQDVPPAQNDLITSINGKLCGVFCSPGITFEQGNINIEISLLGRASKHLYPLKFTV